MSAAGAGSDGGGTGGAAPLPLLLLLLLLLLQWVTSRCACWCIKGAVHVCGSPPCCCGCPSPVPAALLLLAGTFEEIYSALGPDPNLPPEYQMPESDCPIMFCKVSAETI